MREQRNDPKRLRDILQAIDTIFKYVGNRVHKGTGSLCIWVFGDAWNT